MFSLAIRALVPLLCTLPFNALAAESRSIHVEWGYTPPSQPQVTGYKLYKEGAFSCQVTGATVTAMDCTVTLLSDPTNFTLTATFADGTESPHSAPFAFSDGESATPSGPSSGSTVATPPTALIRTSAAAGSCPLSVSFDGSGSFAGAGVNLAGFLWDFGDGTTAATATVSHVYQEPGTYTATLSVTDAKGLKNSISTPIIATQKIATAMTNQGSTTESEAANGGQTGSLVTSTADLSAPVTPVHIEVGDIAVSSNWERVTFAEPYTQPIVVTGPPHSVDPDPCTVRIRNVTTRGFDIRLTEWPYQDGIHGQEKVSYLVLEQGRSLLKDGTVIVAGQFTGTTASKNVLFPSAFARRPVILTSVTSSNESEAVAGRVVSGVAGFSYLFKEQEKNAGSGHAAEKIHYVAWAPGTGGQDAIRFEAAAADLSLTHAWKTIGLQSGFQQTPFLFAEMQTQTNLDPAGLRLQKAASTGFQAKIQEEQSLDSEGTHPAEQIGYLALASMGGTSMVSLSWEYDQQQEESIVGFKILVNGEELCATDDPGARSLSCGMGGLSTATSFTVVALTEGNENSEASNSIVYRP